MKEEPYNYRARKDEYYRNHMIAGKFSNWKCRSMIPLACFLKMLMKNSENPIRVIPLGKDIAE